MAMEMSPFDGLEFTLQASSMNCMFFPAVWSSEQAILRYEPFLVKHLQAPTQQNSNHISDIHPTRCFRKKPTLVQELALNVFCYKCYANCKDTHVSFNIATVDEHYTFVMQMTNL